MRTKLKFGVLILLAAWALPALGPATGDSLPAPQEQEVQNPEAGGEVGHRRHDPFGPAFPDLDEKREKKLLETNLEKSRKDSEELSTLAHEFQKDMDRQTGETLSAEMAFRLERIEKLAKKIRGELGGY